MRAKPLEGEATPVRRGRQQAVPESVLHPVAMATVDSRGAAAGRQMKQLRGLNKLCKFRRLLEGRRTRPNQHFTLFSFASFSCSSQRESREEGAVRGLVTHWSRTNKSSLPNLGLVPPAAAGLPPTGREMDTTGPHSRAIDQSINYFVH